MFTGDDFWGEIDLARSGEERKPNISFWRLNKSAGTCRKERRNSSNSTNYCCGRGGKNMCKGT